MKHPGTLEAVALEGRPGSDRLEGRRFADGGFEVAPARACLAARGGLDQGGQTAAPEGGCGREGVQKEGEAPEGRRGEVQGRLAFRRNEGSAPTVGGGDDKARRGQLIEKRGFRLDAAAVADRLQQVGCAGDQDIGVASQVEDDDVLVPSGQVDARGEVCIGQAGHGEAQTR